MATIKARVETLERSNGIGANEPKRVYGVCGGSTDSNAADFVRAQGYMLDEQRDMVIHIVGFEPCEGEPQPWRAEMGWLGPKPPEKWRAVA